jgi:outer membrane protein assembly factor BamB
VLAPAWVRDDLHVPLSALGLSGYWARDRLWLFDGRTVARVRVDDGVTERVDRVEPTGVVARGGGTVADGFVVGTGDESRGEVGNLVALNPETLSIVWKAASPVGWEPVSSNGAVLAGGYAGGGNAAAVWAVRGDSGASLWRRALHLNGRVAKLVTPGDGCAYAVVEEEASAPGQPPGVTACDVRALDVGTGEVRWSYRVPVANERGPCGLAADADMVVVAAPDGALHVLDAVTGSLRVRAPVDAWLSDFYAGFDMLVRAPMAYVLTGSHDDMVGKSPPRALVAIDLDTGRTRWKHPGHFSEETPPVADDERIYVHTDGGAVHAVALLDGTLQWSWLVGVGVPTAMLVPPEAPRWLLVAGELAGYGGTMGFDLRATPRKSQVRTRISGRFVQGHDAFDPSGIPVLVADQVVRADALGRFSVEVRGEGYALVEGMVMSVKPRTPMEETCPMSTVKRVPLDGKTHADVVLSIAFGDCGEDD